MAGTDLNEEDVKYFASVWKGNLLRLQIFEAARKDRPLEDYDSWLKERLQHMDRMLAWCERYGVGAVLDLHSPPGGQAFAAGYITARGGIFTRPQAQAKFIQVWEKMTSRYKGRRITWGFDLVNEPDDSTLAENCLDWDGLADKTARAIRAIDRDQTLINPAGVTYPGLIGNEHWDKDALERAMRPALEFARKYGVHMYVGEFSAIRLTASTRPGPRRGYAGPQGRV
jgi:endoglucanase